MINSEWELYVKNSNSGINLLIYENEFKSDAKGMASINIDKLVTRSNSYYNFHAVIIHKSTGEIIDLGQIYPSYNSHQKDQIRHVADIFTDRAIYRPSQKLYFKAIVYKKDKDESTILKNTSVIAKIFDPNHKSIATLNLKTNDYGSVFGEFILPQTVITGDCQIQIHLAENDILWGLNFFKIEAYKRPKFEVTFDPLTADYTLDEEVTVSGEGLAFSGAKISEAKVSYRVIREERFFYTLPWFRGKGYWFWPRETTPEEIAQGDTTTDADGKFNFNFNTRTAKPRTDLPRSFNYKVIVNITDINGETQTGEISLNAGDVPLRLDIETDDKHANDQFKTIKIKSFNLNNEKKDANGTLKIFKLIEPNRVIRPQSFTADVDYQLMNEADFIRDFPFDAYSKNSLNPQSWERQLVLEVPFNTKEKEELKIFLNTPDAGHYALEASSIIKNDTVSTTKFIEIFDAKTKKVTTHEFLSAHLDKSSYKIGDKGRITFNSGIKNAVVFLSLSNPKSWLAENVMIKLDNGTGYYDFEVKDDQRFGLQINYYMLFQNAYHQNTVMAKVEPKKDYNLTITTKTFRDKLQPGVPEKWELTISGKDKDKLAAEVLATMYDASLDQFTPHNYTFLPRSYQPRFSMTNFSFRNLSKKTDYLERASSYPSAHNLKYNYETFNQMNFFDFYFGSNYHYPGVLYKSVAMYVSRSESVVMEDSMSLEEVAVEATESSFGYLQGQVAGVAITKEKPQTEPLDTSTIKVRTNLQETAFFFPNLMTDADGNIKLEFTTPEALTKWKLMLVAHTQDLHHGVYTNYVQTQKELMVVPNAPRFLRETDLITFASKISNLTDKNLSGRAKLEILDAFTMKPIDEAFNNLETTKAFDIKASGNTVVSWDLNIPNTHQAIVYRVVAQAGDFSDGEENTLPILPNRMLVTETMPISVREGQTKTFTFDKLQNQTSSTSQNFNLALELTTNPLWTVIGALPYLREFPYDCNEQIFSRIYGNAISTHVLNSSPKIKKVFEDWNQKGLQVSNLEKNQELKLLLLEETPWLREAQSETEQMQRLAVFFEINQMANELQIAKDKLKQRQLPNGGFSWYGGDRADVYITNHIIGGFGKLRKMLGDNFKTTLGEDIEQMTYKAIQFSDNHLLAEWNKTAKKDRVGLYHTFFTLSLCQKFLDD